MFKKILIGYDGSAGADRALEVGINLAQTHQAELWAVAMADTPPRFSATVDEVEEQIESSQRYFGGALAKAKEVAAKAGVDLKVNLFIGHPAQTIVKVAQEEKFDLIVLGHSGLSGVWAKFLGTTAEKVSRHASCSVLIAR
jgi:nucleotide-binding universal stress UspA family protein